MAVSVGAHLLRTLSLPQPHTGRCPPFQRLSGTSLQPAKASFIYRSEGRIRGFAAGKAAVLPTSSASGAQGEPDHSPQPSEVGKLYSASLCHSNGYLHVSELHTIYYEVFGNPNGKPAVFLHGGPGAGCTAKHAQFFDPKHYRIILFDQRACGKSTPRGCLQENTTWHLVEDIEKLRKHLRVSRWIVLGGSWGVALGLAYAETHPHAVSGLILRGVCLMRRKEINWFYKEGANFLFPFGWEQLLSVLTPSEHQFVLSAFYKRLTHDDTSVQLHAAQAWLTWEMGLSFFKKNDGVFTWNGTQYKMGPPLQAHEPSVASTDQKESYRSPQNPIQISKEPFMDNNMPAQVVQARLECHYFMNGGFFEENQLLGGISKISHIPGIIIHGRYDFVCPLIRPYLLQNAFDLHRSWPEANLRIVSNAGHSMYEKGISQEIVAASNQFRNLAY